MDPDAMKPATMHAMMVMYPGTPDQVARVRAEVRQYLDGCPRSDDAVLIVSELAANAVLHSHSRGHSLIVRAEVFPDYAWVEVEDLGGPWHPRQRDGRSHGLNIVAALVGGNWGTEAASDGGRVVWARVGFHG